MATFLETRDRNVVPRWRDFPTTVRLGELTTERTAKSRNLAAADITTQEITWNENPGVAMAGDLISAAIVNGASDIAKQAAEFVLLQGEGVSQALRSAASHVLGRPAGSDLSLSVDPPITNIASVKLPSQAIAHTRKELSLRPSNAILWMDLAYLYAIRGMQGKAERAVRTALQLAPENRFVLRSASRFLVHQNQAKEAHKLIRRAASTRTDPWLISAELALSVAAGASPFFAKDGQSLLVSGRFSPGQLSELGSALGTLEFSAGNIRKAKRHLANSLERPNDNSLAQATWLSQHVNGLPLEIPLREYNIERAFEANAYKAYIQKDWGASLVAALAWIQDQPFSGRAAKSALYIANTIQQDFELGEKIAKFAQVANPDDASFLISLAYINAQAGHFEIARDYLRRAINAEQEDWIPTAIEANYGLIAYRTGQPAEGYLRYAEAAARADKLSEKRTRVNAMTHWAVEEAPFSRDRALAILQQAEESAKRATGPEIQLMLDRPRRVLGLIRDKGVLDLKFPTDATKPR